MSTLLNSSRTLVRKATHYYQFSSLFVTGMMVLPLTPVKCEGKDWFSKLTSSKEEEGGFKSTLDGIAKDLGSQVQGAIDSGIPTQLSYGFVMGYCSGLALKKAGRAAAVVLGMGFMTLQGLQHMGYIEVNHGALKSQVENLMDLNKDGKVDEKDAQEALDRVQEVLTVGLPAGGGFGAGFIGGLRSG
mmetsp:Transcript_29214/g.43087  ORF Transcript_29214/g.43087 Transcript_29214/m.43087 type:complete len:187 (+) Transcript_29214:104-664(+)